MARRRSCVAIAAVAASGAAMLPDAVAAAEASRALGTAGPPAWSTAANIPSGSPLVAQSPPSGRVAAGAPASPYDIDAAIAEAATRFAMPPDWIRAVIRAESGGIAFDAEGRPLVSPAGAIGLMQLIPETYAEMARRHRLGPDPSVPRDNILAGTAFLRAMYDRFGSPGFLAAYNGGPRRWAYHVATGTPLPRETRAYLATVGGRLGLAGIEGTGSAIAAASGVGGAILPAAGPPPDTLFPITRQRVSGSANGLFFALRGSSGGATAGPTAQAASTTGAAVDAVLLEAAEGHPVGAAPMVDEAIAPRSKGPGE